jgi:NhaC family Na+:H+ antiporter
MTQSSVLGISTLAYAPYCFFNIISPITTIIVAAIGWKIYRKVSS